MSWIDSSDCESRTMPGADAMRARTNSDGSGFRS